MNFTSLKWSVIHTCVVDHYSSTAARLIISTMNMKSQNKNEKHIRFSKYEQFFLQSLEILQWILVIFHINAQFFSNKGVSSQKGISSPVIYLL